MRRRKTVLPTLPKVDLDAWLETNRGQIVACPHQPGSLKILARACARRHLAANHVRWSVVGSEPFPIFIIKMNLIPCKNCALGAENARLYNTMVA